MNVADVSMDLCGIQVGLQHPLFLIAGPCVIESEELVLETAAALRDAPSRQRWPGSRPAWPKTTTSPA